jgi:hypothetical protein
MCFSVYLLLIDVFADPNVDTHVCIPVVPKVGWVELELSLRRFSSEPAQLERSEQMSCAILRKLELKLEATSFWHTHFVFNSSVRIFIGKYWSHVFLRVSMPLPHIQC